VSKVFSISKNIEVVDILLKLRVTWSVSLTLCNVVLWRARKSNWLALNWPLPSVSLWIIFNITFLNNLSVGRNRLIGRRFGINVGSLQGFGKVTTFVFFQDVRKCESRMQRLIKCIRCTNGLLGRCLKHLFAMPSIPQALLNFKEYINFCISHDLILAVELLSTASGRPWTLASTPRSWLPSHRS
jgi:hypothetical protein